ncbi:NlpC/P6 family protein [Citromicrobium phage vB_CbaS-RXM]|nr:NlpC/P6 family protein [Citromicrobium phage vB_CbaS-RXM]
MPSDALLISARSWLGTKWMHQGRSRRGVDCVGLLICAAADLGIEVPDLKGYRRAPDPQVFLEHIRTNSEFETDTLPGHFGIFRDGTQPCHVGIFGELHGRVSLLHAYAGTGKVMEEVFDHHWPERLIEIRSLKELH